MQQQGTYEKPKPFLVGPLAFAKPRHPSKSASLISGVSGQLESLTARPTNLAIMNAESEPEPKPVPCRGDNADHDDQDKDWADSGEGDGRNASLTHFTIVLPPFISSLYEYCSSIMSVVLESLFHFDELWSMMRLKFGSASLVSGCKSLDDVLATEPEAAEFCWAALARVSRSFSRVIQTLPRGLRDPICVFYLVLRALDTVEDDMSIDLNRKVHLLTTFHERLSQSLCGDGEDLFGIGEADEKTLLHHFTHVKTLFFSLKPGYRESITEITKRMGKGMSEFAEKVSVDSVKDYDLYCHYVAGLVSRLPTIYGFFFIAISVSRWDMASVPSLLNQDWRDRICIRSH